MSSNEAAKHTGGESSSAKGKRKMDDVEEELEQINTINKKLETTETDFSKKATVLRTFYEAVSSLDRKCEERVTDIKRLKTDMKNAIAGINKMVSEGKILQASISKATIENVVQPLEESEELLCNIAHIYTTQSSPAAPIIKLLKPSGSSVGPLKEVNRAVEKLKEGDEWTVDSSNYLAALLALADQQPKLLILVTNPNEPNALSAAAMAAVATASKGCEVRVYFVDSFLKPEDPARDLERLEKLTTNPRLRLTEFYGHLDSEGVGKLPDTIKILGLAINNKAVATAVRNRWGGLDELAVSVSFPGLKGKKGVESVKPAINALVGEGVKPAVGGRGLHLFLPNCQLTEDKLSDLGEELKGLNIETVNIEDSGDRVKGKKKDTVKSSFSPKYVVWNMDRLFNRQRRHSGGVGGAVAPSPYSSDDELLLLMPLRAQR